MSLLGSTVYGGVNCCHVLQALTKLTTASGRIAVAAGFGRMAVAAGFGSLGVGVTGGAGNLAAK